MSIGPRRGPGQPLRVLDAHGQHIGLLAKGLLLKLDQGAYRALVPLGQRGNLPANLHQRVTFALELNQDVGDLPLKVSDSVSWSAAALRSSGSSSE